MQQQQVDDVLLREEQAEENLIIKNQFQNNLNNYLNHITNYNHLINDRSKIIFTVNGRNYWLSQAICYHRAPDFKIHFSIHHSDLEKAFHILGKLFFEMKCQFGMKAVMIDKETECNNVDELFKLNKAIDNNYVKSFTISWPESMKGREITIYLYQYYNLNEHLIIREYLGNGKFKNHNINDKNSKFYKNNLLEFTMSTHPFLDFNLTINLEENTKLYKNFIKKAEYLLELNNIKSNGCADGDISLGGKYASFRNETFIPFDTINRIDQNNKVKVDINDLFIYPPNDAGWNASGMERANEIYQELRIDTEKPFFNSILFTSSLLFILFLGNKL
ncbi:hypothetical protein ABK040_003178 [Willaertia magna]